MMRSYRHPLVALLFIALAAPAWGQNPPASGEKTTSTVKVIFPDRLWKPAVLKIEGQPTKQTSAERTFLTPPLEAGKKYVYNFEAVIDPNNYTTITRVKEVTFEAGKEVVVDMRVKDASDRIKIRWVPTPDDIVLVMGSAKLANIGKNDIVYDLGCGDAAMLIGAVKHYEAKKGVGIDIDPKMIEKARDRLVQEKVPEGKIEIRQGDVLDVKDISDANVVMLYMADDLNLALRPMLWKSLKPGSRIVSHRFIMGDWKPEKTLTVTGLDGDEYTLHLWTITGKEKDGNYTKATPKKDDE